MPPAFAARRLEIFAAVRAAGGDALRLDPARLRFTLGTSLGDVRVPVQVAPDAADIVRAAASELALLLAARHRRLVSQDDLDRLVVADGYANLPGAAATLGPSSGGADLRAAAELGAASHPALAGGVVCAWMGPGGRGRSLTALFIEALRQALAEGTSLGGGEDTPLVVVLALFAELLAAEERVRDALPAPPIGPYLRAAALTGLWIAARTGLDRALRAAAREGPDRLRVGLEAILSPLALVGARSLAGSTLYGCELAVGVPRGDEVVTRLARGGDPEAAAGEVAQALSADDELSRRAEAAVAVGRVRELLLAGIAAAERAGQGERVAELRDVYCAPGALAAACLDPASRAELARRLEEAAAIAADPGLELARSALRGWRAREPAASLGLSRAGAREGYARAAAALACDAALERLVASARRALVARTGSEAEGGADAEWQAGRLYRVSARGGPILNVAAERPLAHLFADVKDFTRRTGLLGPAAMGEFLRGEFYAPILAAAKAFFGGMPHLADRGGVAVNGLHGDAISFSGDVEALVGLAAEIRRLLEIYQARLARQVSTDAVSRQLAALEARYTAEAAQVGISLADARDAARAAPPGTPEADAATARVAALEAAADRLRDEHARGLARARGEGLEAGVFLAHGAAPVMVVVADEVFGTHRVAIAEKINESARGTARSTIARARADAALAVERAALGAPALEHAWRVFVGAPPLIAVAVAAEGVALAAARAGDLASALRALGGPVREALERAAHASEVAGDVYNGGAALSQDALVAFLAAVDGSRTVRRVTLDPVQLPHALRARWFYGAEPLELIAMFRAGGQPAELFRRAGTAAFKGIGEVVIWELASDGGGPAALFSAYADRWYAGG